jgi:hypothetical protein
VKVDLAAPTLTYTTDETPNAAGWFNGPVHLRFHCDDQGSGIASCPASVVETRQGAAVTATYTAADVAGNRTSITVAVAIDTTAPTITASVSPAPNSTGWTRSDTTVTFRCGGDTTSPITCPAPRLVTGSTNGTVVTGTAIDAAGNTAWTSVLVKIDRTAPTATISGANATGNVTLVAGAPLTGTASDTGSGVATITVTYTSRNVLAPQTMTTTANATCAPNGACTWTATSPRGTVGLPSQWAVTVNAVDVAGNTRTINGSLITVG